MMHTTTIQKKIAVFASGAGSNTEKIIMYFASHPSISISLIVSNKANAGVLKIAANFSIHTLVIEKEKFFTQNAYTDELKNLGIDFIVLAGFLWRIPIKLIEAYSNKIINIHPALLPKYGGKGMYGHYVHEAVIAAKEKESGITIHYVDEQYDHGNIIIQIKCSVAENDTPTSLAEKIHQLEHQFFPSTIEKCLMEQNHSLTL